MQAVLFAAACVHPSRSLLSAAVLARVAMYFQQAPNIWDSCVWACLTDLVLVWSALCCRTEAVIGECSDTIRIQMGLFYIGAGLWKVNTAFLNPRVSCASIYVASLAARLPGAFTPGWLVHHAIRLAPALTISGELALGVCLVSPSRALRRCGIVLAAALHYAIVITPFPNQVAAFGVFCFGRLYFVMPAAWTSALGECFSAPPASGLARRAAGGALVAASALATSTPGVVVDWCIPAQTLLCLIGARAIAIDARPAQPQLASVTPPAPPASPPLPPSQAGRAGRAMLLLLTASYVFVFQIVGIMDISATSPFSQIRQHGGSNHLLLPTSLLQRWAAKMPPGASTFGGGVVRVTWCTSDYMNALYPANLTAELPPRASELLRAAGHIAHEYGPTVYQMLGAEIRAGIPHWQPPRRGARAVPFPVYTIPALQLRTMLAEASASR